MKRKVIVIGIGAGNPDHVTIQAVDALNRVSVLFIPDKGAEKTDLAQLRRQICERFIRNDDYRMVDFATPPRKRSSPDYRQDIRIWREQVEDVYQRLLTEELGDDDCGAFLVWGDPSIYDGTLRILEKIRAKGAFELEYEVIPGISSVQALAARHRVPLNGIGASIMITTGRKLAEGFPDDVDSVVVMLDAANAFKTVDGDLDIHWGAYVGMDEEILLSGKVRDVGDEIERLRDNAREKHGWIMDSYLLTRPGKDDGE
ncbi:precorrin-6A synthase (deacetylating) [Hoeflea sp. CAU 1731]